MCFLLGPSLLLYKPDRGYLPKFKIDTKNDDLVKGYLRLFLVSIILNLRGTKNPGPSKLASF